MNQRNTTPTLLCAAALILLLGDTVGAQKIQFAAQRGPYYVGEPVVVQVVVSGVDSSVDLTCKLKEDAPDALTVQGPQVNRSVSSFTQIINGRMSSRETVEYQFGFVVTANRKGAFQVGPFEITYNGKPQEVAGDTFQFGELENDPDMQIEVSIGQTPIYVGQEVPVKIRWSFAGDINAVRHAFANLQIRSPLFDQFSFRDVASRSRTTLSIATAKGGLEVDAEVTTEQSDGREFLVVTGTRLMVPDTPGQYSSIPVTCRTQKVTQWGRSLFGDLVAPPTSTGLGRRQAIEFRCEADSNERSPGQFCRRRR